MSAPRKATAESENLESTNKHRNTRKAFGKDMEGEDSNLKDVISWESLPSSSQTPRSVTREVLAKEDSSEEVKFSPQSSQNDYEDILKDATESDSDPSIWATSGFLRDKWSSEDEELAGPSQTVPPQLHDDSTRVPLGENKDYINASYIRIMNSGEEYFYIAAQGPLPSTTDDFWQMVLENNSNVIVMITKEIEGGVVKCHHYWPISMKKPLELKNCRIFMENYQILQCFIIRIFQVVRKSTGTSHFIKHLQFTNWPDHGTPAPVDGFIKYVRYVRKSHLTGPVLVHCSAGVGRTGVFLCVDVVFCAIEKNFPFNIKNIVAQMREQRYGMIQTKPPLITDKPSLLVKNKPQSVYVNPRILLSPCVVAPIFESSCSVYLRELKKALVVKGGHVTQSPVHPGP
ncbi:tyrosine-protein phosphatase non-receptor type 20 isoform X4 [Prionailurus viverrinus]|uniref:tyrosine-protein phosphatase non-receptor type 20 isoform X4 n=1 Tax=Prionailurus viverrinus TaxID=61388 RepID=UPI001FF6D40B|nr:tyrosine-protein phosphatase non-receptor type 20 isoform X4 [Prionailurus viverrinus]